MPITRTGRLVWYLTVGGAMGRVVAPLPSCDVARSQPPEPAVQAIGGQPHQAPDGPSRRDGPHLPKLTRPYRLV